MKLIRKLFLFLILCCAFNMCYTVAAGPTRSLWNDAETNTLLELVAEFGTNNWKKISQNMQTRSPKSCRDKYNRLTQLNNDDNLLTEEEHKLLLEYFGKYGNKWSKICTHIPGKTVNLIKNRWNSKCKMPGGLENEVQKKTGKELHHIVSQCAWKNSGINIPNGFRPVILMSPDSHKKTRNYGYSKQSIEFRNQEIQKLKDCPNISEIIKFEEEHLPEDYTSSGPKGSPMRHVIKSVSLLQQYINNLDKKCYLSMELP